MSFKFGFELEGFLFTNGVVTVPDRSKYTLDGFPGLVEVRTHGGASLRDAYFALVSAAALYEDVAFFQHEHTFSGADMVAMRKLGFTKEPLEIRNVYGKAPRRSGNKTLASFQVNVSYTKLFHYTDDKSRSQSISVNSLWDYTKFIKNMDAEFADEIKASNRQPGMYAIKDDRRIEYRSLPNFVFPFGIFAANKFLDRIEGCLKGVV